MHIASNIALVVLASQLIAAPLREKIVTPIAPGNVQQLREVATIKRDAVRFEWLPRADAFAVMAWEDEIEVYDERKLTPIRKLAVGKRVVKFALSRDGEHLAWAENNSIVTIEDLKTGKGVSIDTGTAQPSLAFSPDGKWLATGSSGTCSVWDVSTAKKIRDYETGSKGGISPIFSPNGKILAIGDRNSDSRLFEVSTGKLLHVLPKRETQEIRFNPAGTVLATTYADGSIGLWDVVKGNSLQAEKTAGEELYTVDWSPKGDLLVTAGRNAKIIIWDAKELKPLKELDAPEWVIRVRFSPDGMRLFTAVGRQQKSPDRKITVWGLKGEK